MRFGALCLAAYLVTLWCDRTPENQWLIGCPHGAGGGCVSARAHRFQMRPVHPTRFQGARSLFPGTPHGEKLLSIRPDPLKLMRPIDNRFPRNLALLGREVR
jgi:hypothetical protein